MDVLWWEHGAGVGRMEQGQGGQRRGGEDGAGKDGAGEDGAGAGRTEQGRGGRSRGWGHRAELSEGHTMQFPNCAKGAYTWS